MDTEAIKAHLAGLEDAGIHIVQGTIKSTVAVKLAKGGERADPQGQI